MGTLPADREQRGVAPPELANCYLTAMLWADEALPAAEAPPRN